MATLGTPGDLQYRETVTISAPGATGSQDPVTGIPTASPATVIYSGPADVQDRGRGLARDAGGRLIETWEAQAFLPPAAEAVLPNIHPNHSVAVTFPDGSQATAEVVRARRIDAVVELTRLVPV